MPREARKEEEGKGVVGVAVKVVGAEGVVCEAVCGGFVGPVGLLVRLPRVAERLVMEEPPC